MPNSKNSPNFSGIRKRKWGEYVAEKWDPITRKLVWSGTFNTAEEASEAYLMKQREFASARHMLDEMVSNKIAAASDAERSKGYTFNTAEEASEVCLVKQCEFASARHMFDEMPSNEIVAASAAERSKGYTFNTAEEGSEVCLMKQCEFASAHHLYDEMPSSNLTSKTAAAPKTLFIKEISFRDKSPLLGAEWHNMGRLKKNDPFKKRRNPVKVMNQGKEPVTHVETDRCYSVKRGCKGKTGLVGIRSLKNGKYGAEIRDPMKNKPVWLGTFDTIEEASQAYLSKKCEFDVLSQGNCDQTQPLSSLCRNKKMDSSKTTRSIVGVRKNKWGKYTSEIIDPISKKKIWLGTFSTYEEASKAYRSKKLEFQGLVKLKKECSKKTHSTSREKKQVGKEKLVNAKQGYLYGERFQPKSAAEGILHANQYMKLDVQGSKEAELQSKMLVDFSTPEKQGYVNGERFQPKSATEEMLHANKYMKLDVQGSKEAELQSKMPVDFSTLEKQSYVNGERFQPKSAAEASLHANQYMKLDVQGSKEPELQSKMPVDFSTLEKQGYVNGERFQPKSAAEASLHANQYMKLDVQGSKEAELQSKMPVDFSTLEKQDFVNVERFQPKSAAEEMLHANQYMKLDVQGSKEAELQSKMPVDYSTLKKKKGGQEDADLSMGQWVQLQDGREVKISLDLGLPIIDNYGSLLGEFSSLDDLRIYDENIY